VNELTLNEHNETKLKRSQQNLITEFKQKRLASMSAVSLFTGRHDEINELSEMTLREFNCWVISEHFKHQLLSRLAGDSGCSHLT
jgi:hypothetical protein